jgi:hypothetical protein
VNTGVGWKRPVVTQIFQPDQNFILFKNSKWGFFFPNSTQSK